MLLAETSASAAAYNWQPEVVYIYNVYTGYWYVYIYCECLYIDSDVDDIPATTALLGSSGSSSRFTRVYTV